MSSFIQKIKIYKFLFNNEPHQQINTDMSIAFINMINYIYKYKNIHSNKFSYLNNQSSIRYITFESAINIFNDLFGKEKCS